MKRTRSLLAAVAVLLSLFLLSLADAAPAVQRKRPKLLLAIIIDQFRYDYLLRFRNNYNAGFVRLLEQGAVFSNAQYLHAITVTAIGHSTFLTGAPPEVSGIVGNEWYDRQNRATVTSVSDKSTKLVGVSSEESGSSPNRLLTTTVADQIKIAGIPSKAIGVSIKDRSAILPIGRLGDAAYWYDARQNRWVTSTYYRQELPAWAKAVSDREEYKQYTSAKWLPFDAKGTAGEPFCTMVAGTSIRPCGSLEATPWGNEMIEEFAERALDGEQLGKHEGIDVLAVSFSSNDYVGHAVGPDDPAVRDISIRTDRLLGKLLTYVDQKVGPGNTLVVLSADHGVANVPEAHPNAPGGRLDSKALQNKMLDALVKRFGPGKWVVGGSATMPYFDQELIRFKNLNPAEVENVAADAVRSEPHIARVYTRHQLMNGAVPQDDIGRAFVLAFYGPRSGDLMILQEPGYLFEAKGTSHGTPYRYDTHVPVIFLGPGVKPGWYRERVAPNDIAPTLASMLGVQEPSGSIGRILTGMLE